MEQYLKIYPITLKETVFAGRKIYLPFIAKVTYINVIYNNCLLVPDETYIRENAYIIPKINLKTGSRLYIKVFNNKNIKRERLCYLSKDGIYVVR